MLKILPGAGTAYDVQVAIARPTRIITYAWGEKYLELLLSLSLPALLAPGNLPHVAARVPCQVVILTEERLFTRVASHPVVAQVRRYCDLRIIGLDDLIAAPDKYGMALSYVLHRGFADLGPAMTDCWQILLNADFILADGSLRVLLPRLARGERIVAAPSYCVNGDAATAELRHRIDPQTLALAMPPREMAALILKHRHNTVRGKTVNQHAVSMRYMDQYYWEVDRDTLLGYQMPVAVVGLRPQRYLSEPNAYWDHGLMREFCPDAEPCVLGDSDEFLMLELRSEETAADQLSLGWPTSAEIASRMIGFLTPYQRQYLDYPLTLHAADLPADVEADRAKLDARIAEVFAHVPEVLPSHLNHPQWRYHLLGFTKSRHKCFSKRLGLLTTQVPPPETSSALDQAWWKLDGLEKSYPQRRKDFLESMERDLKWVDEALTVFSTRRASRNKRAVRWSQADDKMLAELAVLAENARSAVRAESTMAVTLHQQGPNGPGPSPTEQSALDTELASLLGRRRLETAHGELARLEGMRDFIKDHYERRLLVFDSDYEAARRRLQSEYERLMPKGVTEAGIPHIDVATGPAANRPTGNLLVRLARRSHHKYFGRMPRVTRLNPHWAPLRHVIGLVDSLAASGANNVFVISSQPNAIERLADGFAGKRARATPAMVLGDSFPLAFPQAPDLHLCLCILDYTELEEFPRIVAAMTPCMRPGGKIIAVHSSTSATALSAHDSKLIVTLSRIPDPVRVHFAGSLTTAKMAAAYQRAGAGNCHALVRAARIVLLLLRCFPKALAANWAEAARRDADIAGAPDLCSSVTLEVTVADRRLPSRVRAPELAAQAEGHKPPAGAIAPGDAELNDEHPGLRGLALYIPTDLAHQDPEVVPPSTR